MDEYDPFKWNIRKSFYGDNAWYIWHPGSSLDYEDSTAFATSFEEAIVITYALIKHRHLKTIVSGIEQATNGETHDLGTFNEEYDDEDDYEPNEPFKEAVARQRGEGIVVTINQRDIVDFNQQVPYHNDKDYTQYLLNQYYGR